MRAAGFVGYTLWTIASVLFTLIVCVILVLPLFLLVALDSFVGEHERRAGLTVVPPAPPQQPFAVPVWSQHAA